jgi:shikimate dehydrogenase
MEGCKFLRLTAKTNILAVIGDPIEHSMSPTMHNAALNALDLDYVYIAFHVTPDKLKQACDGFRALGIKGINVTIPHKRAIIPFLDEIDPIAQGIGAINTIKNDNGKLLARNTDGEGMMKAVVDAGFDPKNKKCVILGAGGAARAIAFMLGTKAKEIVLMDLVPTVANDLRVQLIDFFNLPTLRDHLGYQPKPNIRVIPLERDALNAEVTDADLFINASPIGMHPQYENQSPLDPFAIVLSPRTYVFDCVYNPFETKLLKDAKKWGCHTIEGIHMLVNQGALAFEWWTGQKPDTALMLDAAIKKLGISR